MRHDPILELMKRRWAAAEEVESLTARLVAAQGAARASADALADALSREARRLLVALLAAEHKPRGRVKKGANGGP